jgi:valine--pyruvate aminotransferase
LQRELAGVPFRIHRPEGAFFLWLWFPGLPIASAELYARLKSAGVLVLSGHYFFPGLGDEHWRHRDECLRVSVAQDGATVEQGIRILAAEIRKLYR